jgi:heme/copper-type cytochrome/quinol oxidase subunit 1
VLGALVTTSHGASVDADVWGTGQSLEWACPSPPPPGNFGELALVRSPEPLLDAAESAEEA